MNTLPLGAQWFEQQLRSAAAAQASDLSLEPQDDGSYQAVIRCDGVRQIIATCRKEQASAAIARAKALAELPAYIQDQSQDGSFSGAPFAIAGHIRLAVLPTVRGGRLALRLPAMGPLPEPDALGLPPAVVSALRHCLRQADGLIIISGPSGSGKTTTMHSFLREVAITRNDRSIITIEDPVERRLPHLGQVAVNEHQGLGFLEAVRATLRQDADIIMVGEVRDGPTATACVRAALAGHLVIASTHAPRACEVVPRLQEMGVDLQLLLPVLSGVLAQRLLRLRHGDDYRHRTPIADWISVDNAARQAWRSHRPQDIPLLNNMDQQAAGLVATGATDQAERQRVLGHHQQPHC